MLTDLQKKLAVKSTRVRTRYKYYEMKNAVRDLSRIIPSEFSQVMPVLGWCAKAVDSIADRIVFDEFIGDDFGINDIFRKNNPDIFFDSAVLSALISSCCFVYIYADEDGYPRFQVIDGGNATGKIDPVTGLLTEGYAVLTRDEYGNAQTSAYFAKGYTTYYEKGRNPDFRPNAAPYPLLVPIIHRPDAVRPFGHSRISRACMSIVQSAARTIRRSEVSAEFYSFPQKYVLGLSEDAEFNNRLATISSFLNFTKDGDSDKPTVGQFQQQSMTPFSEQLKMFAAMFAGETGLTLDDLGFATENPSSAEAIKASHENLRLAARKAQRCFGSGFLNVGFLAACVRDNYAYERDSFAGTAASFEPIFEPDAVALSGIGDAIYKLNEAVPGFIGARNLKQLTGLKKE